MCLSVPGQVVEICDRPPSPESTADPSLWRVGRISFSGVIREVSLAYVPEVKVGDYVLVHVGFALSVINEAEAQETLSYLDQLSVLKTG